MNSTDIELTNDRGYQTIGLRFRHVNIPRSAVVKKAFIQFQSDEVSSGIAYLVIRAEHLADSPRFFPFRHDLSNRKLSPLVVSWSPQPWTSANTSGPDQQTSDISSLIQTIIDLPAWKQGNALSIIISGVGNRVAESFDGDPDAAPFLFVEYLDSDKTFKR
ncbi:MAG: hypothetical protein JXR70_16905 [Spirochaetales bacterium]|nr:hypothetical protein [Spirochaetales bacterium]